MLSWYMYCCAIEHYTFIKIPLIQALFMDSLETLMHLIFHQYLTQSYCLTIISEEKINLNFIPTNVPSIQLEVPKLGYILAANDMGCSDYIIQMADPENFMAVYEKVNHLSINRRGDRKLIFLPVKYNIESLLNLLEIKEISFIPNVLLILPKVDKNCETYDLVTHKFVGENSEVNNPLYLDRWSFCNGKFDSLANLFPHNLRNLEGKEITVACFHYKPYVVLDIEDKKLTPKGWDGTDVKIVDTYCEWINCTIKVLREEKYFVGKVYPNGTGNGILGDMATDKADLGIGSLVQWFEYYHALDFSLFSNKITVTSIVPSPRMTSRWELPMLAFSPVMWLVTGLILIFASLALAMAQKSCKNALLITAGILVAQSHNENVANKWRTRAVTGWLLATGVVITGAYCSGLAAIYTVPQYERPIDTVQDLIDSGMEWAGPHEAWVSYLLPMKEPKIKQLVKQFRPYPREVLKAKSFNRSAAFPIQVLSAGHVTIDEYITEKAAREYQMMLEEFYSSYNIVLGRKNSALIGRLNELLGRLHETGLLLVWETQMTQKYLDYKLQLVVKYSRIKSLPDEAPLGVSSFVGIFIIYGIGVLLSTIVFLGEIYIERKKKTINKIVILGNTHEP